MHSLQTALILLSTTMFWRIMQNHNQSVLRD